MDESKTNIDLVFRNGLKDYEVLPPPEVWNNIRPVIRERQRPLVILRAAAAVAVLLSVSFLAYRLSMQINSLQQNDLMSVSRESQPPLITPAGDTEAETEDIPEAGIQLIAQAISPAVTEQISIIPDNNQVTLPTAVYRPASEMTTLVDYNKADFNLRELFSKENNAINILNQESLYPVEIASGKKTDKWTIAALVSPTYYTSFYSGSDEFTSQLMNDEQPVFSYSGGVAFAYKINKRVSVQSGLYYSSFGQELTGITSFGGFQVYDYTKSDRNFEVMTANGKVYTNNTDVFLLDTRRDNRIITRYTRDFFDPSKANLQYIDNSLRQNFSYLELPVILRYKLIDKTIDLNLVGGLSSNFLVNNSVYASIEGDRYQVGKTEGMNLLTFSSSLGMGMEYNFSRNLSLNLEPTFRYYLNPFNQTPGLKIHPYSFGIFSGISYRF